MVPNGFTTWFLTCIVVGGAAVKVENACRGAGMRTSALVASIVGTGTETTDPAQRFRSGTTESGRVAGGVPSCWVTLLTRSPCATDGAPVVGSMGTATL